jgi:L-alanine-DL-glutamate epimerase-like enolase superfamily enzyme
MTGAHLCAIRTRSRLVRIQDMSVHALAVPMEKPIFTWRFYIPDVYLVFVRLQTDEGHEGLGYGAVLNKKFAPALVSLLEELRDVVVGQDPTLPEALFKRTSVAAYKAGPGGIATFAVSAIDVAVWDLMGKIAGLPLYKLLGGAQPETQAYGLRGLTHRNPEELVEEVLELKEQGFGAMKIFISGIQGSGEPREIARNLERIRDAVGPEVKLGLDNQEFWKPHQAIRLGRLLEDLDLFWFEEPVNHQDVAGLAEVAAALDVPVCSGESLFGMLAFRPLIEQHAADIVMIDVRMAGGVTPFMKIAAIAEGWNRLAVNHMMTAIDVHLMAALPNAGLAEYVPWTDRLFQEPIRVEKGVIHAPDRPGFGYALQPGVLEKFAM